MKRRRTFTVTVEYDTEKRPDGEYFNVINPDAEVCAEYAEWLLNDNLDGWGMFAKVTVEETP
jgi:hypothetical protein